MDFPAASDFVPYLKWSAILTAASFVLAVLAFVFGWGIRFRLVGVTGFMGVLTIGVFGLSLGLFNFTYVPGAVSFSTVFDNGANQVVIKLPPTVTESEVEATLRKASGDLFGYGRLGSTGDTLTIRARTVVHPEPGLTEPLVLGRADRPLSQRDVEPKIQIYSERFARLPVEPAAASAS